jgi:hypothetical protein
MKESCPVAEISKKPKASAPLMEAVHRSFPAPHFVTLSEVRDSTGFDSTRAADALALGMFRSRSRILHGFEFKVSRSDWLCELRKPEKAESWFQHCDRWALIVPDASIVKVEELPAGWGLGIPKARGIKWIVQPPVLSPAPFDRHALCAFVFRALQNIERDQKEIEAAAAAYARSEKERAGDKEQLATWRGMVNAFEAATGLSIRYNFEDPEKAKQLGTALRSLSVDPGNVNALTRTLEQQASLLEYEAARTRGRATALLAGMAALAAGQTDVSMIDHASLEYETLMGERSV